jgi:multiple sugar transport system substrate-binding protein
MTATLSFLGRDFVGFRNAIARQVAAFSEPLELQQAWFDTEELYARLSGGAYGDVALVLTDWVPQLVVDDRLVSLSGHLAADPPVGWPDAWSPSMRELQSGRQGDLYGLPYHDGPVMFLYRGDLFDDAREQASFRKRFGYELGAPDTWRQFREIAQHFTRPTEGLWGTVLAGYPDGHNNVYDFLLQLWSRGGELLGPTGAPLFESKPGLAALEFLYDLWHVHRAVDPAAKEWDSVMSGESFAAGAAAMMVNWCGFAALSALPGSPTAGRVRCADVPRAEGAGARRVSLNSYWVMAIPQSSEKVDLAYRFLRHLARPEMDRITSEEGGTGTRLSTWRDPCIRELAPYYDVIEQVHRYVRSPPQIPAYPAVNSVLSEMMNDVITERRSPREALTRAAAEVRGMAIEDSIR